MDLFLQIHCGIYAVGAYKHFSWRSGTHIPFSDAITTITYKFLSCLAQRPSHGHEHEPFSKTTRRLYNIPKNASILLFCELLYSLRQTCFLGIQKVQSPELLLYGSIIWNLNNHKHLLFALHRNGPSYLPNTLIFSVSYCRMILTNFNTKFDINRHLVGLKEKKVLGHYWGPLCFRNTK